MRWMCVAALLVSLFAGGLLVPDVPQPLRLVALSLLAILARATIAHRLPFALCLVALMLGIGGWRTVALSVMDGARARSYFGVYSITQSPEVRALTHGTTVHGLQRRKPGAELMPTSYYGPASGVGQAMAAAPRLFGPSARIGVVGLGAGTLACYARPGQDWRFYEIDPAIVTIARRQFSFLSRCLPNVPILIGDARLTLAAEAGTPFDLLVVDAFSSDAVPAHLLTLEAMEVYRARLAPRGLLLIHISNRFMDLAPVLSAAASRGGWHAALLDAHPAADGSQQAASRWVALARDPSALAALTGKGDSAWQPLTGRAGFAAWTDDYGSILPILKLKH